MLNPKDFDLLTRRPRVDVFEVGSRSRGPAEPYRYLIEDQFPHAIRKPFQ